MFTLGSLRHAGLRFGIPAMVILLVLSISAPTRAQSTIGTGSIVGTVTDPTGGIIVGAKVSIINNATGQVMSFTSNSAGEYNSGPLTPGSYVVRVEFGGFKTTNLPLIVKVNTIATGNVKLEIGQPSEVVQVVSSENTVNTEQATVQGVLNARQIENLPVNGRNFLDMAQLEPGVQIQDGTNFDPTKVGYSSISFGGRFGRTARIMVDGVDVSDETVGTTTEDIPASAIQEFSLAQSNLDLSNDLTSSGAVNVVTRSGSNQFHGEAFELFRDSRAAAALPSPPGLSSPFQRHQNGGRFGGPIKKDKLFFFVDAEHTLQHLAAPVLETNQGPPGTPGNFAGYSGNFSAPFKEYEGMGRLDYTINSNAKAFYRFSYFQNSTFATFFPSSFQVYNNKDITRQHVVGADFTTGTFTHSFRFSYLKFQNQIVDAVRGSDLPFANFPVSVNVGPLSVGTNYLAPQSTPQSNHQVKYDGGWIHGKHIVRYGVDYDHIQGGGFAKFFSLNPTVYGSPSTLAASCLRTPPDPGCTPGPDGTIASNPLNYAISAAYIGNGLGFSTENPAFGYPAGGLGPDNRIGLYLGDTWKILRNLTITPGLRWEMDTGRTDSDLGAIPELNAAFPGWGNPVRNPHDNFAPQLGIAWDPRGNGKTVIRAGMGLFYENVIFNNVLFDRPLRLKAGAFLAFPFACVSGAEQPVQTPQGTIQLPAGTCSQSIGQAGQALANFQSTYQADTPFNLSAPNASYMGNLLGAGSNVPIGLFAPNYQTPRSLQMNIGFQHQIRKGMVLSMDYLRNVTTHTLLGVDINHAGDARYFNMNAALSAIANTVGSACTPAGGITQQNASAAVDCYMASNGAASMADFASNGLNSSAELGGAVGCPAGGCAFGGINPKYGQMLVLQPIGRSVYNALQMKLVETATRPLPGFRSVNFQFAYSLSRFVNPGAWQNTFIQSNAVGINDQDFVIQAADNNNPLAYMGPSLLDRTHQISFGGTFQMPWGFQWGLIAHFYSPLSSPAIVGDTGAPGDIFRTDFTGDGTVSDPMPGTVMGSFGRDFGVSGLNTAIANYNQTIANHATPAGQVLISNNLFSLAQLQKLQGVAPTLTAAPSGQVPFQWLRAMDFKFGWRHSFKERAAIEPSVSIYNIGNFANFDLPPGTMNGWLNAGSASINSTTRATDFKVGQGTGVFSLGSPRVFEFGMRLTF